MNSVPISRHGANNVSRTRRSKGGAQTPGLDANILIRGCLGVRVNRLIATYADQVDFFVAEANVAEATFYIAELAKKKGLDQQLCSEILLSLMRVVQMVEDSVLESVRDEVLARIRDPDDWPALALGMQLECAIWTEDQDYYGTGIATWTTKTVEIYLKS